MRHDSLIQWLRGSLFAAVIAIWVTCFSILGVACWVRDNLNPIIVVTEGTTIGNFYIHSFFPVVFPVLITASCLMLVIGCVGCCGACSDNKVLLGWFFIATLVSLCVEISTGVGGKWGWNANTDKQDVEYLYEKLKSKEWKSTEWINQAWKEIQEKFDCCDIHVMEETRNYDEAVSATCNESAQGSQQPCEETLITFLMNTKVLKVLPLLEVILGILQFVALIITAKLWMMACVTEKLQESNSTNIAIQDVRISKGIIPSTPLLKNTSVQTSQLSSTQYQSQNEISSKKLSSFTSHSQNYLYNGLCPQCAMNWYEETKLMTLSRLEAEYKQLQAQNNRVSDKARNRHYDETVPSRSSSTRADLRPHVAVPFYRNHELVKSASYNSPTDWKSPSLKSVVKNSRDCYSASLPRRKLTFGRRQRRLNYSHNFIQRLSTIRASGVAVEGDASSDSQGSTQEELGASRCYNTEVGSTSSEGDGEPFVRYERSRKISEPTSTRDIEMCKAYRSDYTTL